MPQPGEKNWCATGEMCEKVEKGETNFFIYGKCEEERRDKESSGGREKAAWRGRANGSPEKTRARRPAQRKRSHSDILDEKERERYF